MFLPPACRVSAPASSELCLMFKSAFGEVSTGSGCGIGLYLDNFQESSLGNGRTDFCFTFSS